MQGGHMIVKISITGRRKNKLSIPKLMGGFMLIYTLSVMLYNTISLFAHTPQKIITISHRGRVSGHGVENTISALQYTVMNAHPDYAEIDIQETKDHEFIVAHDANLIRLCGIDRNIYDMNLDELVGLEVREGSFTAVLSDFDDYLSKADEYGQKLLIEVKTTPYSSPDMAERFLKRYGEDIKTHGHIVQSFDIDVIKKIDESDPEISTGLLLKHTQGVRKGPSDFYSIEKTTLVYNFIFSIRRSGKQIFTWTVNNPRDMKRLIFFKVDGIITDNIEKLNDILEHNDKAKKL